MGSTNASAPNIVGQVRATTARRRAECRHFRLMPLLRSGRGRRWRPVAAGSRRHQCMAL